jgi:hypothetical protein
VNYRSLLRCAVLAALSVNVLPATVILSNYPQSQILNGTVMSNGLLRAMGFSMGNTPYTLTSASVEMLTNYSLDVNLTINVSIWSDVLVNGNHLPNTAVFQNIQTIVSPHTQFTHTVAFNQPLLANTEYWMVVSVAVNAALAAQGAIIWLASNPDVTPFPPTDPNIAGFATFLTSTGSGFDVPVLPFNTFELDGVAATPEPGTLFTLATGAIFLALGRLLATRSRN